MDKNGENYNCSILYHLGKANVVADALSKKSFKSLTNIQMERRPIVQDLQWVVNDGIQLQIAQPSIFLAHVKAKFPLVDQIIGA